MNISAKELAGANCGRRYEKEYLNKFRDCLSFYYDGKVRFERFCYGEGACFVFGVWASISPDGVLTYQQPFDPLVDPAALPKALTGCEGDVLYFDNQRWKWEIASDFSSDAKNGYTALKVKLGKLLGR